MTDKEVQLTIDTAFSIKCIWEDVNTVIRDDIRLVLPLCFVNGTKEYEKVNGYKNLPWKTKHHLDIRIEMYNDLKGV